MELHLRLKSLAPPAGIEHGLYSIGTLNPYPVGGWEAG